MPKPSTVALAKEELPSEDQRFESRVRCLQQIVDACADGVDQAKADLKLARTDLKKSQYKLAEFIRSWNKSQMPMFDSREDVPVSSPKVGPQGWRSTLISSLGLPEDIVRKLHDGDIATLGGIVGFFERECYPNDIKLDVLDVETIKRRLREMPELVESLKQKGVEL